MKTVLEMAQEAGFPFNKYGLLQGDDNAEIDADEMLNRFAELVRADERAKLAEQPAPVQKSVGCEWTPCMKLPVVVHVRKQYLGEAHVSTREGITPVHPDDLIMRGVSGEEYPIGITIFLQTYTLYTTPQAPKEENT